jgi:AcrR family transcriptional regulator
MLSRGVPVRKSSSATDPADAALRRTPQQARGRERVALILDAAEALFAEVGYAAATTNAIAARAGVPIGSLYQFFQHKQALLEAVAERYRAGAAELFDAVLTPEVQALPTSDLVAVILGVLVEFGSQRIGFTRLVLHAGEDPALMAAAARIMSEIASRFDAVLAARAPHVSPERRALVIQLSLTAISALLATAIAAKPQGEEAVHAIIAETQLMMSAYLAQVAA